MGEEKCPQSAKESTKRRPERTRKREMIFLRFLQRVFPEVFKKKRTRTCPEGQRVPGDTKSAKTKSAEECPWDETRPEKAKESQMSRGKRTHNGPDKVREPQVSSLKTPGGGNEKRRK